MKMFSRTGIAATGVGSLPHTDPKKACDLVLRYCPDLPYAPTLPNRGLAESIVIADSEHLPGRVFDGERLTVNRGGGLETAMEQVYMDFLTREFSGYGWSPRYASGFPEMISRPLMGIPVLKAHVTGPVTFGMQVINQDRRPILYDPQFADILGKLTALHARWCEDMMAKTGVTETLVILDEPYLSSLGSPVIPIGADVVRELWGDVAGMVEGGLGVHCCANTDWAFLLSLEPSLLSFDAFRNEREFLLYMDDIVSYMEKGGTVAWGIVPSDWETFATVTSGDLLARFLSIRERVIEQTGVELFDERSIVTPSCGIRFADESGAEEIMATTSWIALQTRAAGSQELL
ncbi:MAG: hypothetical protein NT074_08660 [Methanomicrobiales archaeon]|nr:hypothetical protein [Methanomicrobiales archaeon]